jgi:hypothetical protein
VLRHKGPTEEEETRNKAPTPQTEEIDETSSLESEGTEDEWLTN